MTSTFTLAHLSDLHLAPVPALSLGQWNVKRGLGFINWRRTRRAVHLPAVAAQIVSDLLAQRPDHIAVTGDLVNLGLPEEHAAALRWLQALGKPDVVSVVPGNHDIYVRLRSDPGVARWHAYMSGSDRAPGGRSAPAFPYLRRVGPLALIGLNSAVPTPPLVAAGRLGVEQLARLGGLLDTAARDGLVRVVLIHHPPLPGQARAHSALRDADDLTRVLERHGAELVLHGHIHRELIAPLPGPADRHGVSVGVPSASAGLTIGHAPLARYHLFTITRGDGSTRITLTIRGLAAAGGGVVDLGHRELLTRPDRHSTAEGPSPAARRP